MQAPVAGKGALLDSKLPFEIGIVQHSLGGWPDLARLHRKEGAGVGIPNGVGYLGEVEAKIQLAENGCLDKGC